MNLNELAQRVHQANRKWWQHIDTGLPIERNRKELLMLVITEIAEAVEGERKNLMDDKLPHRRMAEVEMADAYIRLLDFSAGFKVHIGERFLNYIPAENKGEALFNISACVMRIAISDERLAASLYMISDYCKFHGYDLQAAFEEKMAYNATRVDHTHEARKLSEGKKW